jgi:glyoxylase-like metal-dependent hydrolase (beta-lactamase superfamily II)
MMRSVIALRRLFCALGLPLLLLGTATGSSAAWAESSNQRIIEVNDHLIAFYDGRDPNGKRSRPEWNWVDDGAMKLGVATYAIYKGDRAIVFDTFPSVEQASWARTDLEKRGVRHFIVVLSHWHMDHTGGNAVYRSDDIIAPDVDRNIQTDLKEKIEAGDVFGPPGVKPLILPTITFHDRMDLYLDELKIELHNFNIHTPDGTVVLIPSDHILLAGDTLEDSATYIAEPADLPQHFQDLKKLRALAFDRIYPNHGDPAVIAKGGYRKTLVDATSSYIARTVGHAKDTGYLDSPLETYIGDSVQRGWISLYEPYREVHKENLKAVYEYYKDKPLPDMN